MVHCLSNYFYVTSIHTNPGQTMIDSLTGYFTDRNHTMFLPPQMITREEAIKMIESGIALFIETKQGKRKMLKNVESFGIIYLRMDDQQLTHDENDFLKGM